MSQAGVEVPRATVPQQVVQQLQSGIGVFAERVAQRVQDEIPAYSGRSDGRRQRLILMAVTESANLFVRTLGGRRLSTGGVDDLFRRMGYGEATEGHNLESLQGALTIAGREAWRGMQSVVIAAGLPASTLGRLGDELTAFLDHLADQAKAGQTLARRARDRDVGINRKLLLDALREGRGAAAAQPHANQAAWPMPLRVAVVTATSADDVAWPDADAFKGDVLVDTETQPVLYLASPEHTDTIVSHLRALHGDVMLAVSWSVPLEDAPHACRWATRALALAASGAIPRQPVIDCARYRTQLWLHAEPALRRQLAQELLKPLFAETPNSREILSETLLVWLETRESAPAIAAILGVHPQTVRYRWRRINELFGDSLRDPEFVVQLTMVLKASVPLWIAGDQSDFERYWSEEAK